MVISMLKIRRPFGRLIFNMGIAIPGKTVCLIETAPRFLLKETQPVIIKVIFFVMSISNTSMIKMVPIGI